MYNIEKLFIAIWSPWIFTKTQYYQCLSSYFYDRCLHFRTWQSYDQLHDWLEVSVINQITLWKWSVAKLCLKLESWLTVSGRQFPSVLLKKRVYIQFMKKQIKKKHCERAAKFYQNYNILLYIYIYNNYVDILQLFHILYMLLM